MSEYRTKNKMKIFILWGIVVLWMMLIFMMSAQVKAVSNDLSTEVTEIIIKTVEKVSPNSEFDLHKFNNIVRKYAHFFLYFVLGFLVLNATNKTIKVSYKKYILISIIICIVYAISDEFHQMFVPGRGPQVRDVFIDSCGAIFGIAIYIFLKKIKSKLIDKI